MKLDGQKQKKQIEEPTLYQGIWDRYHYIKNFIRSQHTKLMNKIVMAIKED